MRAIDADPIVEMLKDARKKADSPRRDLDLLILQEMIQFAPTITPPPNALLTLDQLREMDRNHVIAYLPGEKVYDRFGTPWIIESAEIHLIQGELKQLFRCGHPGTEDYHAMYEDEICTSPCRRRPEEGTE